MSRTPNDQNGRTGEPRLPATSPPERGSGAEPDAPDPGPATPQGADRRRHPRVPWTDDADTLVLEVEGPGEQWREIPYVLTDLAAGGAGILVPEPLEPGVRVRLTFRLPSRLGRSPDAGEPAGVERAPWSGLAELVHGSDLVLDDHGPDGPVPLPYHRGARFTDITPDAEVRLLEALYGPLPPGWVVEAYRTHGKAAQGQRRGQQLRYAVFKHGRRVAWGFATFDRARTRAVSMHMDETFETLARPSRAAGSEPREPQEPESTARGNG